MTITACKIYASLNYITYYVHKFIKYIIYSCLYNQCWFIIDVYLTVLHVFTRKIL